MFRGKQGISWDSKGLFTLLGFVLVLGGLSGCSDRYKSEGDGNRYHKGVAAPKDVSASFEIVSAKDAPELRKIGITSGDYLSIKKSSLDKEFLLSVSMIPQRVLPTSEGLQGRIVAFKLYHGNLFLMEASQGHVVTSDLPSNLILAEIPVLSDEPDRLVVEFNRGMNRIFVASNWNTESGYTNEEQVKTLKIVASFIKKMEIVEDRLILNQIAQVEDGEKVPSFEARYVIVPYSANEKYQAKLTSDFKRVGFFEVATQIEDGTGRYLKYISKWDDSKPIVYHVSANTPKEYIDAIKEGILYWNAAFGREIVKAEVAPEGVTAPDAKYNIVQWVPWEEAGYAYADALMDPRSGEILHAQVYLTSVFALGAKIRARALLRRLDDHDHGLKSSIGLRGFSSSRLCSLDLARKWDRALSALIESNASEEQILRVAQDTLRIVTAHEVGHTLGLRHNFAGSLAASVSLETRDEQMKEYMVHGTIPDPGVNIYSNSVMEYASFEDDTLMAAQMKASKALFSYDQAAIRWGYKGVEVQPEASLIFCTDQHTEVYKDCRRFDEGSDAFTYSKYIMNKWLDLLPYEIVELYVRAKSPFDPRDKKNLGEVVLGLDRTLNREKGEVAQLLSWFKKEARAWTVESHYPYIGPVHQEQIEKEKFSWLHQEILKEGGADQGLFWYLPSEYGGYEGVAEAGVKRLKEYLAKPNVVKGIGYGGETYEFSSDEIAFIEKEGARFFEVLESKLIDLFLSEVGSARFDHEAIAEEVEKSLKGVSKEIILKVKEEVPDGEVPTYKHSAELRLKAAKVLDVSLGPVVDWGWSARDEIAKALKAHMEKATNKKYKDVDIDELPLDKKRWWIEQMGILRQLDRGSPL